MSAKNERVKVNLKTGEGLIIDRPSLISKCRFVSEWTYNLLAWVVWLFLLRPLIVAFLWYLGVRIAYQQMIRLGGLENPQFFTVAFAAIAGIFLALFAWNRYNVFRFRGRERRKSRGECSARDLGEYFKMPVESVELLQASKHVDIYFPKEGDSIRLECAGGGSFEALYAPQELKRHMQGNPASEGAGAAP